MTESHTAHGHVGGRLAAAEAIVDVRSPAEFARGAIVGAVNVPLFSNLERADIGTLYKQVGRESAVAKGLAAVGARLDGLIAAFAPFRSRRLLVYCARGGMRSSAVVSLLASLGYDARQLEGGYKAYRNHVRCKLARRIPPSLLVLHGRTGVGKTRLLARLPNALDLEDIAQHRSSLFGAVNLTPRTQQNFEAHLLAALERLDPARPVWIEGESRKVGDAVIPDALRAAMREGVCVLVEAPLATRVRRIIEEYRGEEPATLPALEAALRNLMAFFGLGRIEDLAARLRRGELAPVVTTLLTEYYDPRYLHAMRNYRYALTVSSESLDEAAHALAEFGERMAMGSRSPRDAAAPPARGTPDLFG